MYNEKKLFIYICTENIQKNTDQIVHNDLFLECVSGEGKEQ